MSNPIDDIPFKRLTPQSTLLPFDCGNADLSDFFMNSAKEHLHKLLSVTYYLESEGKTVHYRASGNHWGSRTLDFIKYWMITKNKTGCCFITVDAYATAVGFYQKNGFKFLGEKERKNYESWLNAHPDREQKTNEEDIPTFAMYFNLLSLIDDD